MMLIPLVWRWSRNGNVVDDNVGEDWSKQMAMKTVVGSTARLERNTTRDEERKKSRRALPKNLIHPLSYRITKAISSEDLLSRLPVHAGARDEVDYGGGTSRERWQNLDRFRGVCGGSRTRVYIGAQRKNPSNMGHAHVTARVGYSSPRSGSDPNRLAVTRPSKTRSNARINSVRGSIPQCASCRDDRASEEVEERVCGTPILTHLPSGATPHLICWSMSLPTFYVGLNLAPTFCLCTA
jgi:hypothetical protein